MTRRIIRGLSSWQAAKPVQTPARVFTPFDELMLAKDQLPFYGACEPFFRIGETVYHFAMFQHLREDWCPPGFAVYAVDDKHPERNHRRVLALRCVAEPLCKVLVYEHAAFAEEIRNTVSTTTRVHTGDFFSLRAYSPSSLFVLVFGRTVQGGLIFIPHPAFCTPEWPHTNPRITETPL